MYLYLELYFIIFILFSLKQTDVSAVSAITTELDVIRKPASVNAKITLPDETVNSARKDFTETQHVACPMIVNLVLVSSPTSVFSSDRASNVLIVRKVTSGTTARNVWMDISVIQKENSENPPGN